MSVHQKKQVLVRFFISAIAAPQLETTLAAPTTINAENLINPG